MWVLHLIKYQIHCFRTEAIWAQIFPRGFWRRKLFRLLLADFSKISVPEIAKDVTHTLKEEKRTSSLNLRTSLFQQHYCISIAFLFFLKSCHYSLTNETIKTYLDTMSEVCLLIYRLLQLRAPLLAQSCLSIPIPSAWLRTGTLTWLTHLSGKWPHQQFRPSGKRCRLISSSGALLLNAHH